MDIARPDFKQKKFRRLLLWAGVAAVVLTFAVVVVTRLKPAAPTVDRSTIWTDTVKRGAMIRQVRGSTSYLVPREDSIELIPAQTDATVVRIRALPGAQVTPNTVLLDLADPQLEQQVLNAQLALKAAQADYKSLQATLQSTLMDKKTAAAEINSNYTQDQLQEMCIRDRHSRAARALFNHVKSASPSNIDPAPGAGIAQPVAMRADSLVKKPCAQESRANQQDRE